jgi:hypothetical protein
MGAGPAHALYFATYEYAKESFGGNAAGHHPVAAGKQLQQYSLCTVENTVGRKNKMRGGQETRKGVNKQGGAEGSCLPWP